MTHFLHHLSWLLRRFRIALILCAAVWAVIGASVWLGHDDGNAPLHVDSILTFFHIVLPVAGLLIFMGALRQDAAPGAGEFWRTRPPRWRAVWCSQAVFALVFIAGPPLLVWFHNGLRLHDNARQWRCAMPATLLFAAPLLALAGVISFSRNWYGMLLSGALVTGGFIGGVLLYPHWPAWLRPGYELEDRFQASAMILAWALVLTCSWIVGMRRPGILWRAIFTGAALLAAPLLAGRPRIYDVDPGRAMELTAVFNPYSVVEAGGGIFEVHGVPEDTIALLRDGGSMYVHFPGPESGRPGGEKQWSSRMPVTARLPVAEGYRFNNVPAGPLRALLPGDTHWYSDIDLKKDRPYAAGSMEILNVLTPLREPGATRTIKLTGSLDGYLISATRLAAVNLESDAVAAENGTRLLMRRFSSGENEVSLTVEMWRSTNFSSSTAPTGLQEYYRFYTHPCLPVLYFPALRMAILASPSGADEEFRSWQCNHRFLSISTLLPSAEIIRGVRFTPETLRGAQLVMCAPVLKGHFILRAPEGTHTLTVPAADEERRMAAALRELDDTGFGQWEPLTDRHRALMKDLLSMGPSAQWAMLRYDWRRDNGPLNRPSAAMELWRPLTDEHLPELIAAARRDYRWVEVARLIGKEEPLTLDALERVRHSQTPLPAAVVALAALAAKPADYERLRHHAAVALEKDYFRDILWQRLRALPDFPWRDLARRRWREGYETYVQYDFDQLCASAALAGETSALNRLLEGHWPGHDPILEPDEWDKLLAMIEGAPSRSGAPDWLQKNRGNFVWDEAAGRYGVQN